MPDELVKRFCEETLDQIKELSADILRMENAERPEDLIEAILRTLHSIKGSSRMLGLSQLAELVHTVEDLFSVVADYTGALGSEQVDKLLSSIDFLEDSVAALYDNADAPNYDSLMHSVQAFQADFESGNVEEFGEIARHAPEIFQALTPQQRDELLHSFRNYRHLYVIELSFSRTSFSTDVRSVHAMLKTAGKLIATTGTAAAPAKEFDLKFLFLHLSNSREDDIKVLFEKYAPEIRELPMHESDDSDIEEIHDIDDRPEPPAEEPPAPAQPAAPPPGAGTRAAAARTGAKRECPAGERSKRPGGQCAY